MDLKLKLRNEECSAVEVTIKETVANGFYNYWDNVAHLFSRLPPNTKDALMLPEKNTP